MITIKLFCAAGMSTSLLVAKMNEAAKKQGLTALIKAYPVSKLESEAPTADAILIGPQVTYLLKDAKLIADAHNLPLGIIPMKDYGMVNGQGALQYALSLIKK